MARIYEKATKIVWALLVGAILFSCEDTKNNDQNSQEQPFLLKLTLLSHFEADSLNDYFLVPGIGIMLQKPDTNYLREDCEDYDLFFAFEYGGQYDTISVERNPDHEIRYFFNPSMDSILNRSFNFNDSKYFESLKDIHSNEGVRATRDLLFYVAKKGNLYFRSCQDTFLIGRHEDYEIRFRDPSSTDVIAM